MKKTELSEHVFKKGDQIKFQHVLHEGWLQSRIVAFIFDGEIAQIERPLGFKGRE